MDARGATRDRRHVMVVGLSYYGSPTYVILWQPYNHNMTALHLFISNLSIFNSHLSAQFPLPSISDMICGRANRLCYSMLQYRLRGFRGGGACVRR